MVNEILRIENLDPSRGARAGGTDRHAGGRDDPNVPRRSADDADWPPDAGGDVTGAGTPRCSNAGRDRSTRRPRRSTGGQDDDKTEAGVQLPREPPSVLAGGL
jgi:hypothetical protein